MNAQLVGVLAVPGAAELRSKVDRHCPRCGAHRYHFLRITEGKKPRASCAECSHSWTCRVLKRDGIEQATLRLLAQDPEEARAAVAALARCGAKS